MANPEFVPFLMSFETLLMLSTLARSRHTVFFYVLCWAFVFVFAGMGCVVLVVVWPGCLFSHVCMVGVLMYFLFDINVTIMLI